MAERTAQWIIESFGETTVRVEIDGAELVEVDRALIPDDAREGDVLTVTERRAGDDVQLCVARDPQATTDALAESEAQLADAPVDRGSGDIAL